MNSSVAHYQSRCSLGFIKQNLHILVYFMGSNSSKPSNMKTQDPIATFSNISLPEQIPEHTINPSGVSVNHLKELRLTHQSVDSLRQTHLNQNTKKSTLKNIRGSDTNNLSKTTVPSGLKINKNEEPKITRSSMNPSINIHFSGQSTKKSERLVQNKNYGSSNNNLLVLPQNIDDLHTIRLSQKSQSYQLDKSNRSNQRGNGYLRGSQRTLIDMVEDEEFYKKKGYFILTDTQMGEKNMSASTAPEIEAESSVPEENKSIIRWIALNLCDAKEQTAANEAIAGEGYKCDLFKSFQSSNRVNKDEFRGYQLPMSYGSKIQ